MNNTTRLSDTKCGDTVTVKSMLSCGSIRRRLQDIGIVNGTKIQCLNKGPGGDPTAYLIKGTVIAIRCEDANDIIVTNPDYQR